MTILNIYPDKGCYKPGDRVQFTAMVSSTMISATELRVQVWSLSKKIADLSVPVSNQTGVQELQISWLPPTEAPAGYGVDAVLTDRNGATIAEGTTALDVLQSWTDFPRYGFLTDFSPGKLDQDETFAALVPFHINGLQFYDWQYRHDQLLPPENEYLDPLGRRMSMETVRLSIDAAHQFGMAAMPYLAVYAASLPFWKDHLDWALYDQDGKPASFMDFLGLMDPTAGSAWCTHLRGECDQILQALLFDGLHVDQYGEPKEGFNALGERLDLPRAFRDFITALKNAHPRAVVTFNAVGNWPIEALAIAPQDFIYIEVWPPKTYYTDLAEIIQGARNLSGGKPVVIALYLPAEQISNIRLADAMIFSCGGSRIELGENKRLLSDPYFPKHEPISAELERSLRNIADFAVRYQGLFGPVATDEPDWQVDAPEGVWTVVRRCPVRLTLCCVNLTGLDVPGWDLDHGSPTSLVNVPIAIASPGRVQRVFWASPDRASLLLQPLDWSIEEQMVRVNLPELDYWSILVFEWAD